MTDAGRDAFTPTATQILPSLKSHAVLSEYRRGPWSAPVLPASYPLGIFPMCVLIVNTVGFVLQKPGTKAAKLILNELLYGVFHFLTSLRSREGGWCFSFSPG